MTCFGWTSPRTLLVLALAACLVTVVACGDDGAAPAPQQGPVPPDRTIPTDPQEVAGLRRLLLRGVDRMNQHAFLDALQIFEQAVAQAPGLPGAWVNLGLAAMNGQKAELYRRAEAAFDRALALDPENLNALHSSGVLLSFLGRGAEARPRFEAVIQHDPHDAIANYYLAKIHMEQQDLAAAEIYLRRALANEPHLSSALYALSQALLRQGRPEGRKELLDLFREFESSGTGDAAGLVYLEMGRYGQAVDHFRLPPEEPGRASVPIVFTPVGEPATGTGTARPRTLTVPAGVAPASVFGGAFAREFGPGLALADVDADGDLDAWQGDGRTAGRILLNQDGVLTATEPPLPGAAISISAAFGDYDDDGDPDLYVACAGPNRLYRNDAGSFVDVTEETGVAGGAVFTSQAAFADLDSDGDLDLYLANLVALDGAPADATRTWPDDFPGTPTRLFNNDRTGSFTDLTERTATGGGARRSTAVLAADLDGDRDADLLVLDADEAPLLLRNDRIWRFVDVSDTAPFPGLGARPGVAAADADGDGLIDLLFFRESDRPATLLWNQGRLLFTREHDGMALHITGDTGDTGVFTDADADGRLDLVLAGGSGSQVFPGIAATLVRPRDLGPALAGRDLRTVAAADLDGDGIPDLACSRSGAATLTLRGAPQPEHHWLALDLMGIRDPEEKTRANTGGVGALVEVVAGNLRQTRQVLTANGLLAGPAQRLLFGLGTRQEVDYVRIVWPDDVIQSESQIPVDQVKRIDQVQRKTSSCPLLFAWDGERWVFVTDFLGTGGLGFFLEPGLYAPPDPTERVLIPVLEPRDGMYEVRIHEPMEEILYLDAARLLVVDHAPGIEIHPDERMVTGAPDADGRLIAIRSDGRIFPSGLETLEGKADPELLRETDRRYQPGIHPDPRFLGYARPQEIVLDFGRDLARFDASRPLFLFLDGWVEYPYSHVNFAAWQAGLTFEPLSLDVETGPGTWETVLPSFGYPAGMPRVMTVDVSAIPRTGTGRLRLRTNIELYVDRLWLAEDLGPDSFVVHDVAAQNATLRTSGYPREYSPDGRLPLLYDYGLMDPAIDFKSMRGDYTRLGDVAPLLGEADDRYVIMGRAEEIVLRYPVPERSVTLTERTCILDSVGWCKDMDLYTAFPHTVAPLPFLGMSMFPYPPSERFPHDGLHRDWQRTWNTRRLHGSR